VLQVHPDQPDCKDSPDRLDLQDCLDHLDPQELQVQREHKEPWALPGLMVPADHQDHRELQVLLGTKDQTVSKGSQVHPDL